MFEVWICNRDIIKHYEIPSNIIKCYIKWSAVHDKHKYGFIVNFENVVMDKFTLYSKTVVKIISLLLNGNEIDFCLFKPKIHTCKQVYTSVKKMPVQIEWIEFKHCLNVYWSMGIYLHKGEASTEVQPNPFHMYNFTIIYYE